MLQDLTENRCKEVNTPQIADETADIVVLVAAEDITVDDTEDLEHLKEQAKKRVTTTKSMIDLKLMKNHEDRTVDVDVVEDTVAEDRIEDVVAIAEDHEVMMTTVIHPKMKGVK